MHDACLKQRFEIKYLHKKIKLKLTYLLATILIIKESFTFISETQLLQCEGLPLSVLCHCKLNIIVFWTVCRTKQETVSSYVFSGILKTKQLID